ncbi:hypothetical protein Pmar_PMAR027227 [Perkinsus marinus ATCC 50983]|uniref:Uncharacterized protein n=1 Tax=Perkinsus marinus (strain ATCC 50983 / TXsc) TaxID=423536 RepID=C5LWW5_PERM5|nr:hypothetical protein Pmar_PMAR027227 [Perkinsus marinus ATCC 50983]EEQ98743.1 hypothetical protein Pmar_PMAR027227 [Perkinsus marinus ATCC 50983]|eukprot:XP_002766026.1 hypothetical protein Pmar_PMAR027227 [Perkinsus marinus ATCC 50983]
MNDHGHGKYIEDVFVPIGRETSLVAKLLNSVEGCSKLHEAAESAAQTSKYRWTATTTPLLRQFGSKSSLRAEVSRRLRALKFISVNMAETFNQQVTIIGNLWFSVYGSEPAEIRFLADSFLRKLPSDVLKALTTHILAQLPNGVIARWENHLQLHEDAPPASEQPPICLTTAIATVCKSIEIAESFGGQFTTGVKRPEKIHRVKDSSSPAPISDFVAQHPEGTIMYFRTNKTEVADDDIREHFSRLGAKSILILHHSHGHTYGFAAFGDGDHMKSNLNAATSAEMGVTTRPFQKPGKATGPRYHRRQ